MSLENILGIRTSFDNSYFFKSFKLVIYSYDTFGQNFNHIYQLIKVYNYAFL